MLLRRRSLALLASGGPVTETVNGVTWSEVLKTKEM
jgi:hypothetical protein